MERNTSSVKVLLNTTINHANIWAGLICILFLLSGISTLHNYGLTWDEGLGNMFFGERYLRYFTSFNQKYLDFNADLSSLKNYPLHLYQSPFHDRPVEFPPLADTLSAATMYLFAYRLRWLNPIDGFHLFTVLLAAIFLWVFYKFAVARLDRFGALMAILFLATFPRFWADMHFNVKDVPETIFFSLLIMVYWRWYEEPSIRMALASGILLGGALSIKANAIFILPILLLSIFPWNLRSETIRESISHFKNNFWHYLIMAVSSISVYILLWPYLYADPLSRLKSYWVYIMTQGSRDVGHQWNIDALREAVTTMPEIMLIAVIIGMIFIVGNILRDRSPFWKLLLLWTIIPILRASLPGTVNFDGIRHYLEFVPAAALIAGYGLSRSATYFIQRFNIPRVAIQTSLVLLLIGNLVFINIKFYPYLHLYYNEFTGGLVGARTKFLGTEASDYWASSYRQGMEWLNQNAPANSNISALIAPWIVDLSGPVILRPDIQNITLLPDFEIMRHSHEPYYLMFTLRGGGSSQDEIDYTKEHAKLVYQIVVDEVPILYLYQFGGQ